MPLFPRWRAFSFLRASVVFWPPTLAGWFVFRALQTHIGMLYLQVPCLLGTVSAAPTSCIGVFHTVCRLDGETTDQSVSSYCSSIWSICSEQPSTGAWLQKIELYYGDFVCFHCFLRSITKSRDWVLSACSAADSKIVTGCLYWKPALSLRAPEWQPVSKYH